MGDVLELMDPVQGAASPRNVSRFEDDGFKVMIGCLVNRYFDIKGL